METARMDLFVKHGFNFRTVLEKIISREFYYEVRKSYMWRPVLVFRTSRIKIFVECVKLENDNGNPSGITRSFREI